MMFFDNGCHLQNSRINFFLIYQKILKIPKRAYTLKTLVKIALIKNEI